MKVLLMPMAGQSSRYNTRPKFLLNTPDTHELMCIKALSGLPLDQFDMIKFVVLKEHVEKYQFKEELTRQLKILLSRKNSKASFEIQEIEVSNSQMDTIAQGLPTDISFIMIKDCDNYFELEKIDTTINSVMYATLTPGIEATNKSYIQKTSSNVVTDIVEKRMISNTFCVGGYCFTNIREHLYGNYPSEAIYHDMLINAQNYKAVEVKNYIDWGTEKEWNEYTSQYSNIFCDIDGVLINSNEKNYDYTNVKPIEKNIQKIRDLYNNGRTKVILLTARSEELRDITIKTLKNFNIPYHGLIMGLFHCKRIAINDFARTNPYPSMIAINIPRDSDTLDTMI